MSRMAFSIGQPMSFGSVVDGVSRYTLRLPQKTTPIGVATIVRSLGHPISPEICAMLAVGSSYARSPIHIHVVTAVKMASGAVGTATADDCGTTASPVIVSPTSRVNAVAG